MASTSSFALNRWRASSRAWHGSSSPTQPMGFEPRARTTASVSSSRCAAATLAGWTSDVHRCRKRQSGGHTTRISVVRRRQGRENVRGARAHSPMKLRRGGCAVIVTPSQPDLRPGLGLRVCAGLECDSRLHPLPTPQARRGRVASPDPQRARRRVHATRAVSFTGSTGSRRTGEAQRNADWWCVPARSQERVRSLRRSDLAVNASIVIVLMSFLPL